jgi:hypothetical protein
VSNGFQGDPPIVTALVTCEQASVSLDPTRKLTLTGLFDMLNPPELPLSYIFMVYVAVTGFVDPFRMTIRLIGPSDTLTSTGTLFGEQELLAQAAAADTSQVLLQGPFSFSDYGRYDIQVYGNGAFLASRAIFVRNPAVKQ